MLLRSIKWLWVVYSCLVSVNFNAAHLLRHACLQRSRILCSVASIDGVCEYISINELLKGGCNEQTVTVGFWHQTHQPTWYDCFHVPVCNAKLFYYCNVIVFDIVTSPSLLAVGYISHLESTSRFISSASRILSRFTYSFTCQVVFVIIISRVYFRPLKKGVVLYPLPL